MTVAFSSNFFLNARGLTFLDGGGVTWSFNQNTNQLTGTATLTAVSVAGSVTGTGASGSPLKLSGDTTSPGNSFYYGTNSSGVRGWYASVAFPESGSPTAKVGLAAVNGSSGAWMDAASAPPIDQAISPTWSATHTFSSTIVASAGIKTTSGTTSCPSGTATTLQTFSSIPFGVYLVSASIASANDAHDYSSTSIVSINGTAAVISALQTGAALALTLSSLAVQANQGSGLTQTITWSIVRIA